MAVNERSTSERIHDAALTLFNDRGYTGTTVRELAEACELTPGAIYNHYASKEALLFQIVDRVHDLADSVLSETLRGVGDDPAGQLEALATAFTAFHIARPRETRVANRDYIYLPAVERDSVVRRRRRVRALFADVLREGERRGTFSLGELGSEDAIQAASMAILNMVVLVAEWFDPAGPRSAGDTAALHGRLALRIARGAVTSKAPITTGGRAHMASCTHLDSVKVTELPDAVDGCEDCLAAGGVWLHLRICLECGHVGCCDDSPGRHATAHAGDTGHPIIRSLEPGETWSWCFPDELAMRIAQVRGETRIPPSPMLG